MGEHDGDIGYHQKPLANSLKFCRLIAVEEDGLPDYDPSHFCPRRSVPSVVELDSYHEEHQMCQAAQ